MKPKYLVFFVFAVSVVIPIATAQKVATFEDVIRRMIDRGGFEGHDAKMIAGRGDGAAVIVTKIIADRTLTSRQVDSVLTIIRSSFAGIKLGDEAEPRTALFLLKDLDASTKEAGQKKRIADTRAFIQAEFEKAKKNREQ